MQMLHALPAPQPGSRALESLVKAMDDALLVAVPFVNGPSAPTIL